MIKALKQQVSDLQSRTSELSTLNKRIASLTQTNTSLTTETKSLSAALAAASKENITLTTKIAAVRSSQPEPKVPGSAAKPRSIGVVLPGTAEAAKDAALQKQKVEMYCDLTNLVIMGVKRNEHEEDVFDCLQTGRNGSTSCSSSPFFNPPLKHTTLTNQKALHFHLSISTAAEAAESYNDTEFIYQPLLDDNRDADLLDLLPDYLTEEISFPRGHAAKFFSKVVEAMSRRVEVVDED